MMNTDLMESVNIVSAFAPGTDIDSDASGDWVNLENYDGCLVIFHKAAGTGGDDPSIAINQATDNTGSDSKAMAFNRIYHKVGATALSAVGTFTAVDLATATGDLDLVSVNGTDLAADTGEALIVVNVRASDLDVDGGFTHIQLFIEGDDLSNSTLAAAYYFMYGCRYPGPTPPSAID